MKIDLMSELLQERETLQAISQITFTFATLNKQFPIGEIREEDAGKLLGEYDSLIKKVKSVIQKHELENGDEHGKARRS